MVALELTANTGQLAAIIRITSYNVCYTKLLRVMALADLVTEMREIKHYYNSGQHARKGIES